MGYVRRSRAAQDMNKAQAVALGVGMFLFIGDVCLPWRGPPDTYRYAASGRRMAAWSKPAPVAFPISLAAIFLGTAGALYRLRPVKRASL